MQICWLVTQPKGCPEVTTLTTRQRLQIMKIKKLCKNCGGNDHLAMKCPKGACPICGTTGHHTSICTGLFPMETPQTPQRGKTTKKIPPRSSHQQKDTTQMNTVYSDKGFAECEEKETVLHVSNRADVLILAGQAQVLNPKTTRLEKVHVMLDSGAPITPTRRRFKAITINTFGSHKAMVKTCGITVLQLLDAQEVPHSFTVTRIDTATESIQHSSLSLEDKRFLCDKDLQLSIGATSTRIQPELLLGCADMFSLLSNGLSPLYVLPSGLQLIPSKLGYLVAGRSYSSTETEEGRATVSSANIMTEEHEIQSWEDFCAFESTGVDEFAGPKAEERLRTDEAVWKTIEQTIARKEDGYWVRLPWKADSQQLPDNKGLAIRRLQALVNRLAAESELFQKYQETLQNQLNEGIIEEVERPDARLKESFITSHIVRSSHLRRTQPN
ncbi:hypothetical protein V3C99_001559 [Haemonchus contortus]|uniref:CCHC-type domain-containing protein n=1 Tax=Haemonchus contortus TaxID=6289 RepID=A0A7I4YEA0_HAECO